MVHRIKAGTPKRNTKQMANTGGAAGHATKTTHGADKSSTAVSTTRTEAVTRPRNALVTIEKQVGIDRMTIEKTAYYKAEKRQFAPGCEVQDWLDAEAELEMATP